MTAPRLRFPILKKSLNDNVLRRAAEMLSGEPRKDDQPPEMHESVRKRTDPRDLKKISMSLGLGMTPPPETGPLSAKPTRSPVTVEQPVATPVFKDEDAFKVAVNNFNKGPLTKKVDPYEAYNKKLSLSESSNNPRAVQKTYGYIGLYQHGSAALQDLGLVKKGIGNSNSKLDDPKNWTGPNAAKYGIHSKEDFLSNPDAQKNVQLAWNKMLDGRMKHYGVDKYVGKTMNGAVMTADGLRAASHLLGAKALRDLLKGGDLTKNPDGNGTTALKYIKIHANNP